MNSWLPGLLPPLQRICQSNRSHNVFAVRVGLVTAIFTCSSLLIVLPHSIDRRNLIPQPNFRASSFFSEVRKLRGDAILSIGKIAEHTGFSISAIRFYESAGLVKPTRHVLYDSLIYRVRDDDGDLSTLGVIQISISP